MKAMTKFTWETISTGELHKRVFEFRVVINVFNIGQRIPGF